MAMDKLTPKYKEAYGRAQNIYWEATYASGLVVRERDGHRYEDINREQLKWFRIVGPGEVIHEIECRDGRSGENLVWRRRRGLAQSTRVWREWHLVGWAPMGPVWAIDTVDQQKLMAPSFRNGDPVFYPPQPVEGEVASFIETAHGVEALLRPTTIQPPSRPRRKKI